MESFQNFKFYLESTAIQNIKIRSVIQVIVSISSLYANAVMLKSLQNQRKSSQNSNEMETIIEEQKLQKKNEIRVFATTTVNIPLLLQAWKLSSGSDPWPGPDCPELAACWVPSK